MLVKAGFCWAANTVSINASTSSAGGSMRPLGAEAIFSAGSVLRT